jgi:hypothetical protein
MSTLTKSRRMPAKYRVRAGGITEIVYSATPEVIVVLPGTRWLEKRREREARLAAEAAEQLEETQLTVNENTPACVAMIDTELADLELSVEDEAALEYACQPDEAGELELLSWTEQMRVATTKLIKRQLPWASSLHSNTASFAPTRS